MRPSHAATPREEYTRNNLSAASDESNLETGDDRRNTDRVETDRVRSYIVFVFFKILNQLWLNTALKSTL